MSFVLLSSPADYRRPSFKRHDRRKRPVRPPLMLDSAAEPERREPRSLKDCSVGVQPHLQRDEPPAVLHHRPDACAPGAAAQSNREICARYPGKKKLRPTRLAAPPARPWRNGDCWLPPPIASCLHLLLDALLSSSLFQAAGCAQGSAWKRKTTARVPAHSVFFLERTEVGPRKQGLC